MAQLARWSLLILVTVAATAGLAALGVPSAALFAALVVGIVLALASVAPAGVPRRAGVAAQGVLGVYIGTMVHRDSLEALGAHWPIVAAVAVGTLIVSVAAGALMGLHRDVSPLTGALALSPGALPARSPSHANSAGTTASSPSCSTCGWLWSPRRCRS